jgi:hypothetical protein
MDNRTGSDAADGDRIDRRAASTTKRHRRDHDPRRILGAEVDTAERRIDRDTAGIAEVRERELDDGAAGEWCSVETYCLAFTMKSVVASAIP